MPPADRIFLLSPAWPGGRRYSILVAEGAEFELAKKVRDGAATIGEVYTFISGLYFRGKMAYAGAFGRAPSGIPSAAIIVPGIGFRHPDTLTDLPQLQAIANVEVDEDNRIYRDALVAAAELLDRQTQKSCSYVLLGSIASAKYTAPLLEIFGERLLFPADFVGRGDMSRGGLMLRSALSGIELNYVPVQGSRLRGVRPPKLQPLLRAAVAPTARQPDST